jgi:hypothetical protein
VSSTENKFQTFLQDLLFHIDAHSSRSLPAIKPNKYVLRYEKASGALAAVCSFWEHQDTPKSRGFA